MRRAAATTIGLCILAAAFVSAPLLSYAQSPVDPRAIRAHALDPAADPLADALAAAHRGDFRLIATGFYGWGTPYTAYGVVCHTPNQRAPQTLVEVMMSDAIGPDDTALHVYAEAYNQALVRHPDYPDADLCRPFVAEDRSADWDRLLVTTPATVVIGPPRSLHEAARRSGAAEVQLWLAITRVNDLDSVGMSALAWATVRGNQAAAEALLAAGANPWDGEMSAVYWAARLALPEVFTTLSGLPGREFTAWPMVYMNAAMLGGSIAIVDAMLAEPHQQVGFWALDEVTNPAILEPFLRDNPALAAELLQETIGFGYNPRLDLVQLALAHGADPNRQSNRGVALAVVATGIPTQSVEIVAALLNAGADPNLRQPIREAVNTLEAQYSEDSLRRARAIFDLLIEAGADLNLTEGRRPLIWELLFPASYAPRELAAGGVTTELLELLVSHGLDLNAEFEGDRVLPLVEAQAGPNSELAVTLRRLGAV